MSAPLIINFLDPLIEQRDYKSQVRGIFFESSAKKDFKSKKEKDEFEWKYLGFYLCHYPQFAWVSIQEGKILGYVLSMPFTRDPSLYAIQPHLRAFQSHFLDYPAHLHINCHAESRGQGIGKMLVSRVLTQMRDSHILGLHIMTGPASENRYFYEKLGFSYSMTLNGILFQGLKL